MSGPSQGSRAGANPLRDFGRCGECGKVVPLRKDGKMFSHVTDKRGAQRWPEHAWKGCRGIGQAPAVYLGRHGR